MSDKIVHPISAIELMEDSGVVWFDGDFPIYSALANDLHQEQNDLIEHVYERRLMYEVEYTEGSPIVYYMPYKPVIERAAKSKFQERIDCFVVNSIAMRSPFGCPRVVKVDYTDERISKSLVAPEEGRSVIVLYDKNGHEGKTEFAKSFSRMLSDSVEWMSNGLFGSASERPNVDTVMYLCGKRYLICDECKISEDISYNNIKRWTSGAPVSFEGRTGFLSHTALVTSNVAPFYKEAVSNSIGKRLVIYHMDKMSAYEPMDKSRVNNIVLFKFISVAISVYNAMPEHPPTSLAITLYTVFRKNINRIAAGLMYDAASSPRGVCCSYERDGSQVRGSDVEAGHGLLRDLAYARYPRGASPYITSLRVVRVRLTEHEIDYVNRRAEVERPVIQLETMLERFYRIRNR
ncbi:hypothetical protein PG989_000074 [Apiospora arundinis]